MPTLAALSASLLSLGFATSPDETNWRDIAQHDVTAIRDDLRDNFPGVYVKKDSSRFRRWLDEGYRLVLADLPKVTDLAGYYYLVNGYAGGFRDSHIKLAMKSSVRSKVMVVEWPGLAVGWRNGHYRVAYVDKAREDLPPLSADLIACDGKSAERIARERLDRYEGNLDLESGRYFTAPKLLWNLGNSLVGPPPLACTFEFQGVRKSYRLKYSAPPNDLNEATSAAAGHFLQTTLVASEWQAGWWIGLPSMNPEQPWDNFFKSVEQHLNEIRAAPYVVIDVRGNHGGDSAYPEHLATMLWGDAVVQWYAPGDGDELYRVSAANRAFFVDVLKQFSAPNADQVEAAEYTEQFSKLVTKMDAAAAAGENLVVMHHTRTAHSTAPPADPMKARMVVLLTDYTCNSACLDMMDMYRALPRTVQAGTSTYADTIFMEETRIPLPSGNAVLSFGHKALVQRPRRSNQPYRPTAGYTYQGDLGDDAAVRTWVADRVVAPSIRRE